MGTSYPSKPRTRSSSYFSTHSWASVVLPSIHRRDGTDLSPFSGDETSPSQRGPRCAVGSHTLEIRRLQSQGTGDRRRRNAAPAIPSVTMYQGMSPSTS